VPILAKLRKLDETTVQYHTGLAQAQFLSGDSDGAIKTFEEARLLFPRNIPVTVRYAEALVRMNQAKKAHEILLDLFNTVPPTPEQARQIALAANAAGDVADAYYYMGEYHLMGGDLPLAMNQLQLALGSPNLTNIQRARFRARLDEIRAVMPRRLGRPQSSERSGGR
jgi:predicted Zn-dependent protease